ncbi:hypothetical protein LSCM1_05957 [Leishmania martiniquensis]|uniref:Leucine-rich repeat protein n=1 Tax=Leishmania martiniquensis TaxID=1580590 RepID=A0A836KSL2_9TRYP|nr:hypothetical protein LSCM1_05957 [Leishmania martiniquensis]
MSVPNFTPEEVAYYASFRLDDPDEAALAAFLAESQQGDEDRPRENGATPSSTAASACGDEGVLLTSSRAPAVERFHSEDVEDMSPRCGIAPADRRRPSASASTALARRQLSARLSLVATPLTNCGRTRYGVTQFLTKGDRVGGVAGIAEAALQTRCVELPARQLTSIAPIQCFLNVTHVYLQHNTLADLEGVELLSQLQVLVVHHNQLTSLAPLQQLDRLFFLDVSHNNLSASVDTLLRNELPCPSLRSLNLSNNPCWSRCGGVASDGDDRERHHAYVQQICAACPLLERLDEVEVEDGQEVLQRSSSSSSGTESDVSDTLQQRPSSAAGAAFSPGRCTVIRRLHNTVEAAREGGALVRPQHTNTRRGLAPSGSPSGTEAALRSQPRHSGRAREAVFLEEEQARLVHQLILRRSVDAASDSAVTVRTLSTAPLPVNYSRGVGDGPDPQRIATEEAVAPSTPQVAESVTAVSTLQVGRGATLQLCHDLQFTEKVSQARLQRDVAAHWDNVSRVLQTAQALQQDRWRRIQQRLQGQSVAYSESLRLLEKESCTKNLDHYRSRQEVRKDALACMKTAAETPVAPPVASSARAKSLETLAENTARNPCASTLAPRPPPHS